MTFPRFCLWLLTRWYSWVFLIVASLTVCLVSVFYSEADLRAVDAQARAKGFPVEWSELSLPKPDSERQARWERILQLSRALPPFYDQTSETSRNTFCPISATMVEWFQHQDRDQQKILWSELDGFGVEPFLIDGEPLRYAETPSREQVGKLLRLLAEQSLFLPKEELSAHFRRSLRLVQSLKIPGNYGTYKKMSAAAVILQTMAERLKDLNASDPALTHALEHFAQAMEDENLTMWQEEFVLLRRAIRQRDQNVCRAYRGGSTYQFLFSCAFRFGRAYALRQLMNLHETCQTASLPQRVACFRNLQDHGTSTVCPCCGGGPSGDEIFRTPIKAYSYHFSKTWIWAFRSTMKNAIFARLLRAEINKKPWPKDPYDPLGAPLRPLEKHGMIIGAYSVGLDGIDNKGSSRSEDDVFLLYLTLLGFG